MGSKHPKHPYHYPINYGYAPNTLAPDGAELDAYLLGVFEPFKSFTDPYIAIIHRLDDDDKLIICPEEKTYTDVEIYAITEFQEQYFCSEIIRE